MHVRWLFLSVILFGLFSIISLAGPVINEVAWGGAPDNPTAEWIELYNPEDEAVALEGWRLLSSDGAPDIALGGTIPPGGYYLLERGNDNTVPGAKADLIYTGALRDSGEALFLIDPSGKIIDSANKDGGAWPAGTNRLGNPPCASMERIDPTAPDSPGNWATSAKRETPKVENSVYNRPPEGRFTFSPSPAHPEEPVLFDASNVIDPNGTIVAFLWDFGDGATGEGQTISHTYAQTGTYTVSLKLKDDAGAITQEKSELRVVKPRTVLVDFSVLPPDAKRILQSGDAFTFLDESSIVPGKLAGWSWDFGDGAVAEGQTASHTYLQGGRYVVTHSVTDDQGEITVQTQSLLVIGRYPTARFGFSPKKPDEGVTITLDAAGSSDPDGTALNYEWDFDSDGTIDLVTEKPITTCNYPNGGDYNITLQVIDSDVDRAKRSLPFTVSIHVNSLPHACFTVSNFKPEELEQVKFADCSSDSDGKIVAWHWDFGDGTTSAVSSSTHTYQCAGIYTVTLTVIDGNGAQSSTQAKITVQKAPPRASLKVQGDTERLTGDPFVFDASASCTPCPKRKIVRYEWDFDGDGTYDQTTDSPTVSCSYSENGTYQLVTRVTDCDGMSAVSNSITVKVDNRKPTAAFTFTWPLISPTQTAPTDAEAVKFTDKSTDPDGEVIAWNWNFGDGATSSEQNPTHQFPDAGTYTVSLIVTDNDGAASSLQTCSITVTNALPTAVLKVNGKTELFTSEDFAFDASGSFDPSSKGSLVSYEWDFDGDGTYDQATCSPTVTHSYLDDGVYNVTVQVTDDDGATAVSQPVTVKVNNRKPDACFAWKPSVPTDADQVSFIDTSNDPDGKIVAWNWNLGDETCANTQSLTHQFPDDGTYTVRLMVTDNDGAKSELLTNTITVINALPVADFDFSPGSPTVGTPVQFTSLSYDPSPNGKIVHIAWDFGDGTSCPGTPEGCGSGDPTAPLHTYTAAGTYTVQLVVIDDDGGLARINKDITVSGENP